MKREEIEHAVIGMMINQSPCCDKGLAMLEPEYFSPKARQAFEAIRTLTGNNIAVDIASFAAQTSATLCAEYVTDAPLTTNFAFYAQKLITAHKVNRLTQDLQSARQVAATGDLEHALRIAEDALMAANADLGILEYHDLKTTLTEVSETLEGERSGGALDSHIQSLDCYLSGWWPTNLYILAARPGMGKTAFAMNEVIAQAKAGHTVLFVSLEMGRHDLAKRVLSSNTGIQFQALRRGALSELERAKIKRSVDDLNQLKGTVILDERAFEPHQMLARAKGVKATMGLNMIVVDYLQLMRIKGYQNNRTVEVTMVSQFLKKLAKELEVPVMALCQLNRSTETRQSKRPVLSDLRESGGIEQDADAIIMMYREDYYNEDCEEKLKGVVELIVTKNRHGPTGTALVRFNAESMSYNED